MGTKPMTNEELDAIEAREKAATAGPWVVWSDEGPVWLPNRKALPRECLGGWTISVCHHEGSFESSDHRCVATAIMRSEDDVQGGADAAFIAAARADVPVLIAEVRSHRSEILCLDASVMDLRAEHDALRAEVERLRRAIRRFVDAVYADSAADEERKRCLSACEEPFNGGASAEEMAPLVLEHLRAQVRLRDAAKDVRDGIEELTALVRMPPTDEVSK